jgi:hypothetical protein
MKQVWIIASLLLSIAVPPAQTANVDWKLYGSVSDKISASTSSRSNSLRGGGVARSS